MTGTIVTLTKYEDSEEMGDMRYEERKQIQIAAGMIAAGMILERGSRKSGKRAEQIRVGRGRAENEQNRSGLSHIRILSR